MPEGIGEVMSNEIGKAIGKVTHSFGITGDTGWKSKATIEIDFSGVSDADIKSWLASNRIIAGQRVWRAMDLEEFESSVNGQVHTASDIGKKVKTKAEKVSALMAIGLPEDLAKLAVDNPASFQNALDKLNVDDVVVDDDMD